MSNAGTRRAFLAGAAAAPFGAPVVARAAAKVTLGIVNTISDAPYFIADAKGYFKAEGLDVDIASFPSGAKMISSLSTGDLDVSGGAVSAGLYNANEREIAIKIVADKARNAPGYGFESLLVRTDLITSGAFRTLADLRGRRVAIPAIGSAGEQSTLNEICKKAGIGFDDVERVYLATGDQFAALANGAIDATIVSDPSVTLAQDKGVARRFLPIDEVYPDQQAAVTTFGAKFLTRRSEAAAFMRAFLRAARDYNDALEGGRFSGAKGDEVVKIIARYSSVKDEGVLRRVTPSACDPNGRPNLDGLAKDLAFVQRLGLVDAKLRIEQVVDLSFRDEAERALGPYRRG